MHFDYSAPSSAQHGPSFTNPWSSSPSPQPGAPAHASQGHGLYLGNPHHHQLGSLLPGAPKPSSSQQPLPQHPPHRSNTANSATSLASYSSMPVSASSGAGPAGSLISSSYEQPQGPNAAQDLLGMSQDVLGMNHHRLPPASAAFADYSTSTSPVSATYAAASSGAPYDSLAYAASTLRFAEALDASHGMLAMSQETPRGNAYGGRSHRDSADSYGFPTSSTHSTNSSISSHTGGTFNSYYADSLSEYSTAGSDIESVASRSGLAPSRVSTASSLMGSSIPPAPQSMMGQFSSKISGSTQKKHKCKVCDKRFTRPSSLQTHMYSHTGEKRE
jgi:hypothetical protein